MKKKKMNLGFKIFVSLSALIFGVAILYGCGRQEEQASTETEQMEEQAATETEQMEEQAATESEKMEQETSAEREQGQKEEMAASERVHEPIKGPAEMERAKRSEETLAVTDFMDRVVYANDGMALGKIEDVHSTGEDYTYVLIRGNGDNLHPVPTNLLTVDTEKGELMASFDHETFLQSPSISKDKLDQLTYQNLENARGYFEEQAGGGQEKSQ